MGISIEVGSWGPLALTPAQEDGLATGGLDEAQVYFEYITQHDSHVRPSHAALDGTVWKLGDAFAPIPPLDFGCRCSMRYVGKPGTVAARVLPEAAAEPTTRAVAYATHLDETVPEWRKVAEATAKLDSTARTGAIVLALKDRGLSLSDARDLAMMILEAVKPAASV